MWWGDRVDRCLNIADGKSMLTQSTTVWKPGKGSEYLQVETEMLRNMKRVLRRDGTAGGIFIDHKTAESGVITHGVRTCR